MNRNTGYKRKRAAPERVLLFLVGPGILDGFVICAAKPEHICRFAVPLRRKFYMISSSCRYFTSSERLRL